jgi:uncharacterized protein YfiM (DUF2279 family)
MALFVRPTTAAAGPPGACGSVLVSGSSWLSGGGVSVFSNGSQEGSGNDCASGLSSVNGHEAGEKWQCVELVNRLYLTKGWIANTWRGDAGPNFFDNAPGNLTKQADGAVSYLGPGDVIDVGEYLNGSYIGGHVVIVDDSALVSSGTVNVVSQNSGSSSNATPQRQASISGGHVALSGGGGGYSYVTIGVIHAPPPPSDTGAAQPKITSAMYNDGGVALTFTPPKAPSGRTIVGYAYDVSLNKGAAVWDTRRAGTASSPVIAECPFGSICTYRIRAVFDDGLESPSSSWVTVAVVTKPTINTAAFRDGGVGLYFTGPSRPSGATIRDYEYDVSLDGGGSVWDTRRAGATSSPFVAECPFGSTCTYRIRAVFDGGESASSSWKTMTIPSGPSINGVTSAGPRSVSISFSASAGPAGATVRDYEYDVSLDGGTSVWDTRRTGSTSSPSLAECPSGATCTYRMRAVYDGGESLSSAWVTAP